MEKQTSSANRLVLRRILAQEGNKKCADCKTATHPRWASWNIGVLICIRCSGVHRSLGTHISKVRSIDLDTWNENQLEKLVEFGNARANAYWEAQLPDNYVPDESKMHNFIRTKYELRRWVPKPGESVKPVSASPNEIPAAPKHQQASGANISRSSAPPLPPKVRSANLLDLNDAFSLKPTAQPSVNPKPAQAPLTDSLFGDFTSAKPAPVLSRPLQTQTPLPSSSSSRADVKKSILSLYSQPNRSTNTSGGFSSQAAAPNLSTASFTAPTASPSNTTSSSTSLNGLGFGNNDVVDDEDSFSNVWN